MKYFLKKKLFAILFLAVLFGYAGVNAYREAGEWLKVLKEDLGKEDARTMVSHLEDSINESLYGREKWIELHAYTQVLMDKKEYNNFSDIKDKKGYLHYASFFREDDDQLFDYALRVRRLQDYVKQYDTKVIFLVTSGKYVAGETEFDPGLPVNDPNSRVDELLFHLNRLGVPVVDCRKEIPGSGIAYEDAFYKTDHHWTVPAAFEATKMLVRSLNEIYDAGLDPEGYWLNKDNFEEVTYEHGMCGSMGRSTGGNYVGLEDFTAYWPKFRMNFSRQCMEEDGSMRTEQGDISTVLMNPDTLKTNTDIYTSSQYSLYLNELRTYETIVNQENTEGPSMLALRDSYFSPVMVFLAPMFSRMDAIWTLETSDAIDIETYVKDNRFDYIVIEVYPYNINNDAFQFFQEASGLEPDPVSGPDGVDEDE